MALRVLQATSRAGGAVAASASRAAASAGPVRFFSDAVAEEDEAAKLAKIAAENALMEKLQQQQFADADISGASKCCTVFNAMWCVRLCG